VNATRAETAPRPFLIAHRGGNRLERLRESERLGISLVEADVRLFRGRLEVRHLKTVGPLPLLWDRWELASPWAPRLRLGPLLQATGPSTELLLDLKGPRRRLGELVANALTPYLGRRRFTVCARSPRVLEPFVGLPVRRFHSVGSKRQLARLLRGLASSRADGVSIHARLLDRDVVRELRRVADVIVTWPVNRAEDARRLTGLGVDGLISDEPAALLGAADAL
jgi:glycerophosphoryl diester phosphodiesterase